MRAIVCTELGPASRLSVGEIDDPEPGSYRLLYGRHPAHTFAKTQNTPVVAELFPILGPHILP